jgi:hypothetical protein
MIRTPSSSAWTAVSTAGSVPSYNAVPGATVSDDSASPAPGTSIAMVATSSPPRVTPSSRSLGTSTVAHVPSENSAEWRSALVSTSADSARISGSPASASTVDSGPASSGTAASACPRGPETRHIVRIKASVRATGVNSNLPRRDAPPSTSVLRMVQIYH